MEHFSIDSFDKGKNYVIEASAGTGKTYNIVQIVKKLVSPEVPLEQILIVTYTDKAAGELKDRIRKALSGQDVDSAPIYTIHSFCQNTIKSFGISSVLPLSLNVIGDEELRDFAERYVRQGEILADIKGFMSLGAKLKLDALASLFVNATNKYYLGAPDDKGNEVIELDPSLKKIDDQLCKLALLWKAAKRIEDLCSSSEEFEKHYKIFETSQSQMAQKFCNSLKSKVSGNSVVDGRSFKIDTNWCNDVAEQETLRKAFSFFRDLDDCVRELKDKEPVNQLLVFKYLDDFYEKWQKEKELSKAQTFNDMIRYVRESVLAPDSQLLGKLREKYKYAIIDEFQDTNQIQFDIFRQVFLCKDHQMIVVGDPKQSIYSFQGADVQVYLKAKEIIGSQGIVDLNKNYRSTSAMVDSCNCLFRSGYFANDGIKFEDCDSLSAAAGDSEHEVKYEGGKTKAFWITDEEVDANRFAQIAVETIIDCCSIVENDQTKLMVKDGDSKDFRSVTFGDFAVLTKTRSEMVPIEQKLREAGIPSVRYKDKGLFGGKECADWIALLTALEVEDFTGENRKIFKKTLFTQFFGLTIKEAANPIYSSDENNEPIQIIKQWRIIARERRWEDLFDAIIFESNIMERMASLSQMQSWGIYKQIADYCVEYLSNGHSMEELIKRLTDLAAHGNVDEDESGSVVAKSTNLNAVQIMTIHASKGLQFPVVIAAGGFKGQRPPSNDAYTYHDKEKTGRRFLCFTKNDQISAEEAEESKRLFYVAYTRAQFVMILPNYGPHFGKHLPFLKDSLSKYITDHQGEYRPLTAGREDMTTLKQRVQAILERGAEPVSEEDNSLGNQESLLKKIIELVPTKRAYKHSYSSLSHPHIEPEEEEEIDEQKTVGLSDYDPNSKQIEMALDASSNPPGLPPNYPKGAPTGTALHRVFELIDFQNCDVVNLKKIIRQAFQEGDVSIDDGCVNSTITLVRNVLGAVLPVIHGGSAVPGKTFTLKDVANSDKKAEVEFNFNYENEWLKNYCNGFIDLLFRREGDYYCVLDWKSDSLNEEFQSYSDNGELKKHVDDAYSIQRVLYSYCLIKWLKGFYPGKTEEEIFENHFGGIYYVFLRGCFEGTSNGVYCQTWQSWEALKDAFDFIVKERTGGGKNE